MYHTKRKTQRTVYQLISTPAVLRSETDDLNTVYSIISVMLEKGAAKTALVYDVTRIKSIADKILSQVIESAPSGEDLCEFIAELL